MNGAVKTADDNKLVEQYSAKKGTASKQGSTGAARTVGSTGGTAITLTLPGTSAESRVEDLSSYLERMYAAKKQAAMAQLKNAYDSSIAELDRAGEGLAAEYQAARNEAASAHETARRGFAEFAAANGLNSGAAGQAELARGVTLQNSMNDIRTAEASAVADLTLQRAKAEKEYNAAIAQAEYTGEYELAAALYEEKVRVQEALAEQEIRQQQNALERYQLQYRAQRDAVDDQRYESEQAQARQKYQDSLALEQAAQALKEKEQADDFALAQLKYRDSRDGEEKERLAQYGTLYLKAGVMPSEEMRNAMGITAADAHKYILAQKASAK